MKNLLIPFALLLISCSSYSQDTLFFNNNSIFIHAADYTIIEKHDDIFSFRSYRVDGSLMESGYTLSRDSLNRTGFCSDYALDGQLMRTAEFSKNILNGRVYQFSANSKVRSIEKYKNGVLNDSLMSFYPSGSILRTDIYKNGELKSGKCYSSGGRDTTWFPFRVNPEFPGGIEKLHDYLIREVIYPKKARESGISGTVYVTFTIKKDGSVANVAPLNRIDESLITEAVRVIEKMPKWSPGQLDGENVSVQFNMPIKFTLQDSGFFNKKKNRRNKSK